MKKNNRILSFLLALVMIITLLPATVLAEGETDVMKGWSITLGDDIGVKFYLDSADYTVTATVDGEAVTPAVSGNIATVNVAAAQMNDPIVVSVADEEGVVYTGKYTVRQYGLTVTKGNYAEEAKDMVRYMLNYGGAAQTYFDHYADKLANTGITVSEITMPEEVPQISITDNLDGINFYGASLVMRNKTAVRFYFQVTGDISSFTFSQGTPVLQDDLYYVEIDGINPQDYAEDITLSVNDGALAVTYSPLTYIARMYSNAESSDEMKALAQAMYGYHLEAVEYESYLEAQHTDHIWLDATCTAPKTCSVCGEQEGTASDHSYEDGFCSACGMPEVIRTQWNMSNSIHAADWTGYHSKAKNEALTTTVTEDGFAVDYLDPGNGWKGIVLEKTSIGISDLTGKLTFTYSSDMTITSYRIHILTNLGGSLTANGTADCYTAASIANITAGNLEAWTQTANEDGTVTVTFDLSSMGHFTAGNVLKGLTIVTVTANETPGAVTYKSIALELDVEGHDCQTDGHIMMEATCTAPKTCYVCGAAEGEAAGHVWVDATCTAPKTCSACYAVEGEPAGHAWTDATCTAPKTCGSCGLTEGEALGHTWVDATCTAPQTCSVCSATEGEKLGHTDADNDLVCEVCTDDIAVWNMNDPADAIEWSGYHSKIKNEELTTTVTEDGLVVDYLDPGNGWKGIVLEETALDISKLTGKLTFTYSSDLAITSYRIHIVTDLGGNLTANGTADCYTAASVADITAGSLEAWTQTVNADGSITVTFDLSTMNYFANGTELKGLTIVTVTANKTPGAVTHKYIEIEKIPEGYDCETEGHIWQEATCTEPKTCSVCGETEGDALGHSWIDATCTEPKTCSVCGETEGEAAGHTWIDATCTAPATCSACGITEGTAAGHTFVNGVCSACDATEAALATPVVWDMSVQADASQWYSAQAYTSTKPSVTTSEITDAGFVVNYFHKNGWKGIVLKNVEIDITGLSGLLSFTYKEEMDITAYRIHILTDLGGDLGSNSSGTPSDYYASVSIDDIAASTVWTRTENADGTITVTFDLSTLPFFEDGTVLMGMDIVTVTATGTTGTVTYKTIEIR